MKLREAGSVEKAEGVIQGFGCLELGDGEVSKVRKVDWLGYVAILMLKRIA